jgi:hypothetical protein
LLVNPLVHIRVRLLALQKTPLLFEFPLCVSRACLGKILMAVFSIENGSKKAVSRTISRSSPARL